MTRGLVGVDLQRDGRVFVKTYSRNTNGMWMLNGLPRVLPNDEDAATLGQAVIAAVEASPSTILPARNVREDPPDREFLAWLGLKTYAAYAKGVRGAMIDAFLDGDRHLLISPQHNGGPKTGFVDIREHREKLTDWTPSVVGAAVQRALTLATV